MPHLPELELRATLRVLAHWHAYFWLAQDADGAKTGLAAQLWETGGYWHLGQQPAGQIDRLRPNYDRLKQEFDWPAEWDLGVRLEKVALQASKIVHGLDANNKKLNGPEAWVNAAYQTIIHGDPKAPNLFFKRRQTVAVVDEKADGKIKEPQVVEVGMIDLQWCGRGIGAVDIVYCIAASADPNLIPLAGSSKEASEASVVMIQGLVDEYYNTLLHGLVTYGVADDAQSATNVLPAAVFMEQFEWAWIDLARVCVGDHWSSVTKEVLAARRGKMAFNAYNKSETVATLVASVAHEFLIRREHASATVSGNSGSAQAAL